jgi:hypothetical protein
MTLKHRLEGKETRLAGRVAVAGLTRIKRPEPSRI